MTPEVDQVAVKREQWAAIKAGGAEGERAASELRSKLQGMVLFFIYSLAADLRNMNWFR